MPQPTLFETDDDSGACFSMCRRYRYTLWRRWDASRPMVAWIGLNPSTADEWKNDPTVTRCIRFSQRWGYGSMYMLNLFAFRATDPRKMKAFAEPVGPDNDTWILSIVQRSAKAIAAWGNHGGHMNRGPAVRWMLEQNGEALHCLVLNKDGSPKHPLYVGSMVDPMPYAPSVQDAMKAISDAGGKAWADVDAEKVMRELRE